MGVALLTFFVASGGGKLFRIPENAVLAGVEGIGAMQDSLRSECFGFLWRFPWTVWPPSYEGRTLTSLD